MIIQILLFIIGFLGLYLGAEWLVRGAARLARTLGTSALVVGLTVVALGTSAPELVVSGIASARAQGSVAIGNVIGSNILNIAVILGLTALLYPIRVQNRVLRREMPLMIAASFLAVLLALDEGIERWNGILLLIAFVGYIAYTFRVSREDADVLEVEFEEFEDAEGMLPAGESPWWDAALVAVGITVLSVGAHLMVTSAVGLAEALGISQLVIGLTVVSLGTSLPELATVLVAAVREEADIALGNAVGSNIFNLLAILGAAAVIRPLPVEPSVLVFELPVMVLLSLVLLLFAWTRLKLERWEGAVLLAGYVVFTFALFARAANGAVAS